MTAATTVPTLQTYEKDPTKVIFAINQIARAINSGVIGGGGGGGGTPGGSNGQIQYNSFGTFGGFTMRGDASIDVSTGAVTIPVFGASGPSHAKGEVPDPGSTPGTARFLCENAQWAIPISSVAIADTPPSSPGNGSLWWESDTGLFWVFYNDGNSTQWVGAVAPAAVTISDGAPTPAMNGSLWWQSSTGAFWIYYNDGNSTQWVSVNPPPSTLPTYTVAALPAGSAGQTAFASDCRMFNGAGVQEGAGAGTGGLVVYNGTAWKIAGTNVTAIA